MLYPLNHFNTFKIAIAFFTIAERKILALIQPRKKFNLLEFWGILQFLINFFKILLNNTINYQIMFTIRFCSTFFNKSNTWPKDFFFKICHLLSSVLLQTKYGFSLMHIIVKLSISSFINYLFFYQFINLEWKFFLPFAIGYFLFTTVILIVL